MNSRVFFASDLHGSELAMNKLLNAAQFYGVKRIVIGGDITGKVLVPIIKEGNRYSLELFGEQKRVKESGLEEVEHEIRVNGEYYHIMERGEYEAMKDNPSEIKRLFIEEMLRSLDAFISKAHEKLRASGAKLFLIPGNDDYEEVAQYIKKNSDDIVTEFDKKIVDMDGYELLGYGYSNKTPWNTPRERDESTIQKELSALSSKADSSKAIYVIHVPPFDTKIDLAPELTSDMKQKVSSGYMHMRPVGSTAVRKVLEEMQPIAGLHGHIHESSGRDVIKGSGGEVPVFNPGSDYSSGILDGIIIDFDSSKITRYNFTKG
ncbi:MAG: metallophosphoesterase [Candidatus Marsarchaeota archaeon]|jgi:Icc-related predicted phosphoesterase|nr:metallophosphoesterase [Candidatus Marsarchaeota archaeon]